MGLLQWFSQWDPLLRGDQFNVVSKKDWKAMVKRMSCSQHHFQSSEFHLADRAGTAVMCGSCSNVETGTASLQKCSRCGVVRYCSQECQSQHWPFHKKVCKRLAAMQA